MKIALCIWLALARAGFADYQGVINDPDGYVNVRREKRVDAPVVARVKPAEPFSFECERGDDWCHVTLSSGKMGWMHHSRIRLHFTGKDLRGQTAPGDELHSIRDSLGMDYYALARRAAAGDREALKKYFGIMGTDGAAAELHFSALPEVFHLVGDEKFTRFLRGQLLGYRLNVRASLTHGHVLCSPFELIGYLRRHFPQTAELLFRREITDWPSPDGRYSVRKTFSDEEDLEKSRVARAELIENATGQVLCDMTKDDIGTGEEREGQVLWSSDSKRFAYLSIYLPRQSAHLFSTPRPALQKKQTTVYQKSGEVFAKVEIPLEEPPGEEDDAEVKNAVLGHDYIEPVRWAQSNVLVLERHKYFEHLKEATIGEAKFDSIHSVERLYEITITINADDSATTVVTRVRPEG